ncbi:hypothetical protein J4433_01850 [Candidatus Pacearchaeota archaeon]|nr:hypothetical protein [Candidatus Pacearchaeota archaeon]
MELVALLSTGKGSWAQISGLIKQGSWEKVILVGEQYAEKFKGDKPSEFIFVDFNQPIINLKEDLMSKLRDKLQGTEVALSIASGSGKEHMALIAALLCLPVGIRFMVLTKEGVKEL